MKVSLRRARLVRLSADEPPPTAIPVVLLLLLTLVMLTSCAVNPAEAGASTRESDQNKAVVTLQAAPVVGSAPAAALPTAPAVAQPLPAPSRENSAAGLPVGTADSAAPTLSATRTLAPVPVAPLDHARGSSSPTTPASSQLAAKALEGIPLPGPSDQPSPTPVATSALTQEVIHILLIGGDTNYTLDMNTDTLIVVVVNRSTGQVSLLSIPRDLWVYIPTYGWGRINTAHKLGARLGYAGGDGPGLLMRTIEENIGIRVDHWVRVGYDGFGRVVDELGGIDVVVPCAVNLNYTAGGQERMLAAGVQHLDGETALRYVRTRRGDSDYERTGRQQHFLKAVWNQFKTPESVLKLPGLWLALKDSFDTDLELGDILALAPIALDLQPGQLRSRYIGRGQTTSWTTPDGAKVLIPIPERVEQVISSLYEPPRAGNGQHAGSAVRVKVLNGTDQPQLGLIAADQLRWEGIKVVETMPADHSAYSRTKIFIHGGSPEAFQRLIQALGLTMAKVVHEPESDQSAEFRVVLGADYDPCP